MIASNARVVMSTGNHCLVIDEAGELHRCQLRSRRNQRPVCGDFVRWANLDEGGVIDEILPRSNVIERGDFRGQPRPLAANIDQLILVIAPEPEPDSLLIDRYLVLAAAAGIPLTLWLNKTDLLTAENTSALEALINGYRQLGVDVARGSAIDPDSTAALRAFTQGKTVILAGQSGVGKSSLTQALIPELALRIGAISSASGQGRHTTTETTLFTRSDDGALIDSPGVRTLRLDHLHPGDIDAGFPEVAAVAGNCRFRDCQHQHEPNCAVLAALEAGDIAAQRLENWRRLRTEAGTAEN